MIPVEAFTIPGRVNKHGNMIPITEYIKGATKYIHSIPITGERIVTSLDSLIGIPASAIIGDVDFSAENNKRFLEGKDSKIFIKIRAHKVSKYPNLDDYILKFDYLGEIEVGKSINIVTSIVFIYGYLERKDS